MRYMQLPQRVIQLVIARRLLRSINPVEFVVSGVYDHQVRLQRQGVLDDLRHRKAGDRSDAQIEDFHGSIRHRILQHRF